MQKQIWLCFFLLALLLTGCSAQKILPAGGPELEKAATVKVERYYKITPSHSSEASWYKFKSPEDGVYDFYQKSASREIQTLELYDSNKECIFSGQTLKGLELNRCGIYLNGGERYYLRLQTNGSEGAFAIASPHNCPICNTPL